MSTGATEDEGRSNDYAGLWGRAQELWDRGSDAAALGYQNYLRGKEAKDELALPPAGWLAKVTTLQGRRDEGNRFRDLTAEALGGEEAGYGTEVYAPRDTSLGRERRFYDIAQGQDAIETKVGGGSSIHMNRQLDKDEARIQEGWSVTWVINNEEKTPESVQMRLDRLTDEYGNFNHVDLSDPESIAAYTDKENALADERAKDQATAQAQQEVLRRQAMDANAFASQQERDAFVDDYVAQLEPDLKSEGRAEVKQQVEAFQQAGAAYDAGKKPEKEERVKEEKAKEQRAQPQQRAKEGLAETRDAASEGLAETRGAAREGLSETGGPAREGFADTGEQIRERNWTGARQQAQEGLTETWGAARDGVGDTWGAAREGLADTRDTAKEGWTGTVDAAQERAGDWWDGVTEGVAHKKEQAQGWVADKRETWVEKKEERAERREERAEKKEERAEKDRNQQEQQAERDRAQQDRKAEQERAQEEKAQRQQRSEPSTQAQQMAAWGPAMAVAAQSSDQPAQGQVASAPTGQTASTAQATSTAQGATSGPVQGPRATAQGTTTGPGQGPQATADGVGVNAGSAQHAALQHGPSGAPNPENKAVGQLQNRPQCVARAEREQQSNQQQQQMAR